MALGGGAGIPGRDRQPVAGDPGAPKTDADGDHHAVACRKGMAIDVEASVDLEHWTPVGTVLNTDGKPPVFTDPVPAHGTSRFYRVTEK